MVGKILPPLVGLKVKNMYVQKGHPLVIKVTDPEYAAFFDGGDVVPPLIVLYAHGDKKICGNIYNQEIIGNVYSSHLSHSRHFAYSCHAGKLCEHRKSSLDPGEYVTVLIDGVPAHLSRFVHDPSKFVECEERRQTFLKLGANATSKCQVCDLLPHFNHIKVCARMYTL